LPTVQLVLHADWQEVWHSPQPPLVMLFFSVLEVSVLTCFIVISSYRCFIRTAVRSHAQITKPLCAFPSNYSIAGNFLQSFLPAGRNPAA
jgi:hypothetical protein